MGRTVVVAVAFVVIAGCASTSGYSTDPGPPTYPPLVNATWTGASENGADCAIALLADGGTAIATAYGGFWTGVAVGWLGWWATGGNGGPTGMSLKTCYDTAQTNWPQINLLVKCWGQPAIQIRTDIHGYDKAIVRIPMCQCNLKCIMFSTEHSPLWRNMSTCPPVIADWMCTPVRGGQAMVDDGTVPDPPAGPLPADWMAPGWDVNAPVPLHPVDCALPDCSDQLN